MKVTFIRPISLDEGVFAIGDIADLPDARVKRLLARKIVVAGDTLPKEKPVIETAEAPEPAKAETADAPAAGDEKRRPGRPPKVK